MKSNLGILSSNSNILDFLTSNNLINHLNFDSVASRNIEDSKNIAAMFKFKKYYGSYEEVISDKDIDLVINFLPNPIKFEYTYLLLKAGKKVISNYPIFNSNSDISFIEEIISSEFSKNLFLIYNYDYSRLVNNKPKNIIYTKHSNNSFGNNLSSIQDLFFDKSPDLFYLLNHYKNEDIKVNVIKKNYDSLYNKLSYLNAFISINDNLNINIIIDNIGKFDDFLTISNHNTINLNTDIVTDDKKAYNQMDLLSFIKNNKTFDNYTFFQYYPYKLFNEVINV
jgi:hypothetical protein